MYMHGIRMYATCKVPYQHVERLRVRERCDHGGDKRVPCDSDEGFSFIAHMLDLFEFDYWIVTKRLMLDLWLVMS